MAACFYLVRHGMTQANLENRFSGRTGEALHPAGVEQMRQLGKRLQPLNISGIYSGPLARVAQSAGIIGAALGLAVHIEEDLNEISIPHWDGLSKQEIRDRFGDEYPCWLKQPAGFKVPGCESLAEVQDRAVAAVEKIRSALPAENILLVGNLIVLRCLVLHYRGLAINDFRSIKIDNGAIIRL